MQPCSSCSARKATRQSLPELLPTGRRAGHRGFGLVELGPGDDATRAIGEFNGLNVDGRALMVNEARQESGGGRTVRGGGRGFSGGGGGRGGGGRRSY